MAATRAGVDETDRNAPARLRFSRQEADAIAALAPATVLTDFRASKPAVAALPLADIDILHLASHASQHATRPDLSGLVLSLVDDTGTPVDGRMRLHEVVSLSLSGQIVVLSACQTIVGADLRGEGLQGLARGFLQAGARTVVASLWDVDDRATMVLMRHFYEALVRDGLSAPRALERAQQAMRKDARWAAPRYWAGFVTLGHPGMSVETQAPDEPLLRLLSRLGSSDETAGDAYEALRRLLCRFFEVRGATDADGLTDQVLDRVSRRVRDGVEIADVHAYARGVARLVLLESRRRPAAEPLPDDPPDRLGRPDRGRRRGRALPRSLSGAARRPHAGTRDGLLQRRRTRAHRRTEASGRGTWRERHGAAVADAEAAPVPRAVRARVHPWRGRTKQSGPREH